MGQDTSFAVREVRRSVEKVGEGEGEERSSDSLSVGCWKVGNEIRGEK